MADERKIEKEGRRPHGKGGREPYPAVRQDDAIELADENETPAGERRSFAPQIAPFDESWLGPGGDPAEGKR
jgi:hypothetical protein